MFDRRFQSDELAKPRPSWPRKCLAGLLAGLGFLCRSLIVGWATRAIYFSNLPWAWLRLALASKENTLKGDYIWFKLGMQFWAEVDFPKMGSRER